MFQCEGQNGILFLIWRQYANEGNGLILPYAANEVRLLQAEIVLCHVNNFETNQRQVSVIRVNTCFVRER